MSAPAMSSTSTSTSAGTVIVTGGAGDGIGQGICHAIAERGWRVIVADFDEAGAVRVAAALRAAGHDAIAVPVDVADEASVGRLFAHAAVTGGRLLGLVNSAGVGLVKPLAETTTAEWDRLLGIDLRGAYFCARAAINLMRHAGGGSIVNIGSVQALGPHVGYSAYAAAKSGMVGLTKGIAADHGRDGIRANIVHPGMVDSPQNRRIFAEWGDAQQFIDRYVTTRQMLPSLIQPEDIGRTVAFLLSDDARSITASEVVVDAGSSQMAFDNTEVAS